MPDAIQMNIEKVEEFQRREDKKRSHVQRVMEHVSVFFSNPRFLLYFVAVTLAWVIADLA